MADNQATLQVGLGATGARVIAAISSRYQAGAEAVSFNVDNDPFLPLCAGYRHEVLPDVINWATTEGARHQVATWFDIGTDEPPLRDLPDIFIRNNRRSEMRAIFLMQARFVLETLVPAIRNCQRVAIISSTHESSGTTWSIELAGLIFNEFPEMDLRLLAVDDSRFQYPRSSDNRFWFLREISCKNQLRSKVIVFDSEEAAIDALLASAPPEHHASAISLEEAFDRTTTTFEQEMSELRYRAFELCRAQPVSALVDSDHRAALACLWMAIAENRTTLLSASSGRQLTITLRDLSSHQLLLTSSAPPSFGELRQILYAFALSHRLMGGPGHRNTFDALVTEGLRFLSGHEILDESIRQLLSDHRDTIENELNESRNVSSVSRHEIYTSAVRHDFNSLLVEINRELLNSR